MTLFQYQPLKSQNETRIFVLAPGEFDDPLVGTFVHADLSNLPEYEAISYCWMSSAQFEPLKDYPPDTEIETTLAHIDRYGNLYDVECTKVKYGDIPNHGHELVQSMYYTNLAHRSPGELTCDTQAMTVGGELFTALRRFRFKDRPRKLWADAICINQDDLDEKAIQIRNMDPIFGSAQKVLVWLGESLADVWEVFLAIPVIEKKLQEIMDLLDVMDGGLMGQQLAFDLDPEISEVNWTHMTTLLRRAWFSRIWCLQEIVKAQEATICVEDIQVPWMRFAVLMYLMRKHSLDESLLAKGEILGTETVSTMLQLQQPGYQCKLLDLLRDTRQFKSTLPCDKVFAILGLVSEDDRSTITIDYHLSPEAVYTEVAISQIRKHDSLIVLYQCCKSRQASALDLPSWVPDWTQPSWHENFESRGLKTCASLDTKPVYLVSPDQKVLSIRARIVDEVQLIDQVRYVPRSSIPMPSNVDANTYDVERPRGIMSLIRETDGQLVTKSDHRLARHVRAVATHMWLKESIYNVAFVNGEATPQEFEAVWRTFMCDQTMEGEKPGLEWGEYFTMWLAVNMSGALFHEEEVEEWFNDIGRKGPDWDLRGVPSDVSPLQEKCRKSTIFSRPNGLWTYNRRFFRSKGNSFGWCPDGVEIGDKIAVVDGLDVPLVLRRVEHGYEVCGDAYLYGIMHGEAMSRDIKAEMIDLI